MDWLKVQRDNLHETPMCQNPWFLVDISMMFPWTNPLNGCKNMATSRKALVRSSRFRCCTLCQTVPLENVLPQSEREMSQFAAGKSGVLCRFKVGRPEKSKGPKKTSFPAANVQKSVTHDHRQMLVIACGSPLEVSFVSWSHPDLSTTLYRTEWTWTRPTGGIHGSARIFTS